jgi:hypothetical protein
LLSISQRGLNGVFHESSTVYSRAVAGPSQGK